MQALSVSCFKTSIAPLVCSLLKTLCCPIFSVPCCSMWLCCLFVSRHSALLCWSRIQHPESASPASVTELLQQIAQYESTVLDGIRKALENAPPSVSSVSESMEDLEVEQANSSCCGEGCKETASGCCRGGEKMDLDAPNKQQKSSSGSTGCASSSSEGLNCLLQRCMDLVSELGLPQELNDHIQELKNLKWWNLRDTIAAVLDPTWTDCWVMEQNSV